MLRTLLCATWMAFTVTAIPFVASGAEREQLPSGVTPIHYDLALVPDPDGLTFNGRVGITINVQATTPAIILNSDELVFDKALLDKEDAAATVSLDTKLQRATLTFAHPVAAGGHTITIDYHSMIGHSTLGFFAMDYNGPAGKRRTIATNFEPASERRFMPSWDEPGLKATFSISVDVPADQMAVSNMPVASSETLASGQKRVHFAVTPKMSTYLLFLGIGDFERISTKVAGTDIGVVVNRGDGEKGRYALDEAARLLHYYNDYFGVAYPLPKLDLVVAPGEITGSSMENWGAIFYGQADLLFDPKSSTEADRQRVFLVVAHEMSHQWFGDLVTMAWWDNLWLNEGFARWMQTRAADELHPEWKTGLKALAIAEAGKRADAKPSTHPVVQPVMTASQAEQAFDNITYDKGASVIGMLETYVGPNAFRDGIRRYMKGHAYGNTVDADLWREVQAVAGKPVLDVEADFTKQPGVPLVKLESERASGGTTKVTISEGRFAEEPATIASAPTRQWRIPITLSAGGMPTTQLLPGAGRITVEVQGTGPVLVNAGQSSYVRTLYTQPMLETLGGQMADMNPADQLGLLYDTWALGESGYAPVTGFLDLAGAVPPSADPVVWSQIISTLSSINRFYEGKSGRAAFAAFARQMLRPLADRLGWDPQDGEESNVAILRNAVLAALSRFGDQPVIAEARRRFEISQRDPQGVSPAVRRISLSIVARNADAEMLERLVAQFRATQNSRQKQILLGAMAGILDTAGAQRILELAIGPDAPAGTTATNVIAVSASHPDMAWDFALQHVDQIRPLLDSGDVLRMMPAIAARSSDLKRIADLESYADQNIPAGARQDVESAISTIKQNAKFRAERLPEIDAWLANKAAH
jgi:aminopeptidase N